MSFLLDTNVISELRRLKRAGQGLVTWSEAVTVDGLYLSAVTIMEIELGILRAVRKDLAKARILRAWLEDSVLPNFAGRILPFDLPVALRCAQLQAIATRPERDAMIAATALVHGLTVVTRNVRDFAPMQVPLLDP